MKTDYSKLYAKIRKENLNQKTFRDSAGVGGTTMAKIKNNESITTKTICNICDYFCCMPDEIMDWIPEANYPERIKAKQQEKKDIETQIADLQEKLRSI